jgi:predicted kinase
LANIVRIDHRPVLFDGIEFSADIACVDVFYDLAFLLMDLQHRGLRGLANLVLNRYLARSDDFAGVGLLALFQSLRAGVRAMVNALEAGESEARAQTARAYLDDALAFLSPADPVLIAVGGLSGTGKSTLAAALAPAVGAAPGAVTLRSDVIRKRLFAVAPEAPLPQAAYRPEVSARVYERQRRLAAEVLAAGHAVIADAVFARPEERAAIEAVAASAGASFHGLWLEAPLPVMIDRVGGRRDDASDATAEVVRRQSGYETGTIAWRRLDAAGSLAQLSRAARDCLGLPGAA